MNTELATGLEIQGLARHARLATISALLALAASAPAGTHTWTGTGFFGTQDYLWSNPANWSPVGEPAVGENNVILIFPDDNSYKFTTNDIVGLDVAEIQFYGTNYSLHGKPAGNPINLKGGASGWKISVLKGDEVSGDTRCYFAQDCPLVFKNSGTLNSVNEFICYSTISGPGGFTNAGNGIVELRTTAGTNTFTGATHVTHGQLWVETGLGLGIIGSVGIPGPLFVDGGFVSIFRSGEIATNVPITIGDDGQLWLNGFTNTFASITMIGNSDLRSDNPYDGTQGLIRLNGSFTNLSNGDWFSFADVYGNLDLGSGTRTFYCEDSASLDIRALISGNGGITKTGDGTLNFRSANTYAGVTMVQGGALQLDYPDGRPGTTANGTAVLPGGTIEMFGNHIGQEALDLYGNGTDDSISCWQGDTNIWDGPITLNGVCNVYINDGTNGKILFTGAISGGGSLRKTGDGQLEFTGFGGNTFTGTLFAEEGTTHLNKSASAPAFSGPLVVAVSNSFNYSRVLVEQVNQIPNSSPISIFRGGVLDGTADDTIGDVEIGGGTLSGKKFTLNGSITNRPALEPGVIDRSLMLPAGTHYVQCDGNSILTVSGDLQGSGGITKTGTGTLELLTTNNYSGLTTIQGGKLQLTGRGRPGSTSGGTFVENGGQLSLENCSVTNELLSLDGAPANGTNLEGLGTNRWNGPVVLNVDAGIETSIGSNNWLILDGTISGMGGINYAYRSFNPPGTVELTGSSSNSFKGTTSISGGKLRLNKSTGPAVPGNLVVGSAHPVTCLVLVLQPNQIGDASAVTIETNHTLQFISGAETIGSLGGSGALVLGATTLTAGGNGNTTVFSGNIFGTGGFTKTGAGTLTLSGDNSFSGPTVLNGGTMIVNGQQQFSSLTVQNGATLGGNGRVGNMAVNNGATIAPGTSPGTLTTGNINILGSSAALQIEINGTNAGTYDQLAANGSVSMIGGLLQVDMNIGGAVSNQYVIVNNDGSDPVSGTFTGLPEGASLTNNGAAFVITYHGGDSNDVVLIQQTIGYISQIISGQKQPNGRFGIAAIGAPNTTYRVDASTNLTPPVAWVQIGTTVANSLGNMSFSDVSAPLYPIRFYRLRYP